MSLYEAMKVGERNNTLARVFNVREGFTPEDDQLPQRMHEGIGNGALKGQAVDRDEFTAARRTYYEMAGWDPLTGRPTSTKLAELGLDEATRYHAAVDHRHLDAPGERRRVRSARLRPEDRVRDPGDAGLIWEGHKAGREAAQPRGAAGRRLHHRVLPGEDPRRLRRLDARSRDHGELSWRLLGTVVGQRIAWTV